MFANARSDFQQVDHLRCLSISTNGVDTLIEPPLATSKLRLGPNLTTGTIAIGGTAQTGAITIGQATVAQTVDIATGAISTAIVKAVNIGTNATSLAASRVTIGSLATTAGTGVKVNGVMVRSHPTAVPTVTVSVTAAEIVNAGIVLSASGGATALVLPTGALLGAAMPGGAPVDGDTVYFLLTNTGAGTITLTAGASGCTVTGASTLAGVGSRMIACRFTSATAYVVY
jgi:hypothetical protein